MYFEGVRNYLMFCFNHNETGAVQQCEGCGKGLCRECVTLFSLPICSECNHSLACEELGKRISTIVFSAILFIIPFFVADGFSSKLIFGYIFGSLPWGYQFMGSFYDAAYSKVKVIFTKKEDAGNHILKQVLIGLLLGPFVAPFAIIKTILRIRQLKQIKTDIESMHYN